MYKQIICICNFLYKEGVSKELCAVSIQKTLQENNLNRSPPGHTMAVESLGVHRAWLSIRAEDGTGNEENASCHLGSRVEPVRLEYLSVSNAQSCHQRRH